MLRAALRRELADEGLRALPLASASIFHWSRTAVLIFQSERWAKVGLLHSSWPRV